MKVTFNELEKQGYTGMDDLEICLYKYSLGIAWKYIEKDNGYKFYFKVGHAESPNDYLFNCTTLDANMNIWNQYDWIKEKDKESMLDTLEITLEEFNKLPFPEKINELFAYFWGNPNDILYDNGNAFKIFIDKNFT